MATKPMTKEAIALTEMKMGMTLDDIIKMSKKSNFKVKKQRASNKSKRFLNADSNKGNASKVRRFMDMRSSFRQGVLSQRRSNFQGNQFPLTTEAAKKAAAAPVRARPLGHSRMVNWNMPRFVAPSAQMRFSVGGFRGKQQAKVVPKSRAQTLDSMFANMKEQRIKAFSHQQMRRGRFQQQRKRGRFSQYSN